MWNPLILTCHYNKTINIAHVSILKKIKRYCYTCCICGAIPRDFRPSSCLVPIKLQVPHQNHWNILEILLTLQYFKCLVISQRRNVISTTQRLVLHFMAFPVFFFWQGTHSYMAAHFNGFKKTVLRSVDFSAFSFFLWFFCPYSENFKGFVNDHTLV